MAHENVGTGPETPEEIQENFEAAFDLFLATCDQCLVESFEEAQSLLQRGPTCIDGGYKGANVRLYPPDEMRTVPLLTLNIGNDQSFIELAGKMREAGIHFQCQNLAPEAVEPYERVRRFIKKVIWAISHN